MKITITKANKEEYVSSLNESLDRFIVFATNNSTKEVEFKGEMHIVPNEYGRYIDLARHLKDNLNNVCLHVHNACYDSDLINEVVYPAKMLQCLYDYRYYCYGNRIENVNDNFQSLEEQNINTKNYVHFDFSVKKIKTLESA